MTDYDKVDEYLQSERKSIRKDFDDNYENLSKKDQVKALLQTFFSHNGSGYETKYKSSAETLQEGLEPYYVGRGFKEREEPEEVRRGIQVKEKRARYQQVKYKSGRAQYVYRNPRGRFSSLKKWGR